VIALRPRGVLVSREVFIEFLKTSDAKRAEPWQLEELSKMRFPTPPGVGTYKALRSAMAAVEPPPGSRKR
jgi:hypothetical protein